MVSTRNKEVKLRVIQALRKDVGKGLAKISRQTAQKLDVSKKEPIEIIGRKTTSAIVGIESTFWWGERGREEETIQIDGLTRKNAEVEINEFVIVRRTKVKDAISITLAPIDMKLNVDWDFTKFVKKRFMKRTFVEGNITIVMMLGHAIPFTVAKTNPQGIVMMKPNTELIVLSEPVSEAKREEEKPIVKEIVREVIIKVRCPHCHNVYDETMDKCPYCGAPHT